MLGFICSVFNAVRRVSFQIKLKLINSKKEICQARHAYTPTPQINFLATAQLVIVY